MNALQEELTIGIQNGSVDTPSESPMTQRYPRQSLPVTQIQGMSLYPPSQRRTVKEQRDTSGSIRTMETDMKSQCSRYVKYKYSVCFMGSIHGNLLPDININLLLLSIISYGATLSLIAANNNFIYAHNISSLFVYMGLSRV